MHRPALIDKIGNCVIRDYFTPNVTAEVTLGCLLTPKLPDIINAQCGLDTKYVSKEMSIPYAIPRKDNRGCKIDYVLADDKYVFLTELKTTPSIGSDKQLLHYIDVCKGAFGQTLGARLLDILSKEFSHDNLTTIASDDTAFTYFFRKITHREPATEGNANIALNYERTMGYPWHSSRRSKKYLFTLGEILDYLKGGERSLWKKPMEIIYLMPEKLVGKLKIPKICRIATLEQAAIDLGNSKDEYSRFLSTILNEIVASPTQL